MCAGAHFYILQVFLCIFCIKYILLYSFNQSTIICTLSFFISQTSYYFYLFSGIFFHKVPFIVLIICILIIFCSRFIIMVRSSPKQTLPSLYFILTLISPYKIHLIFCLTLRFFHINISFYYIRLTCQFPIQCIKASDRNSQEILIIISDSLPSSTQTYLPNFGSIR